MYSVAIRYGTLKDKWKLHSTPQVQVCLNQPFPLTLCPGEVFKYSGVFTLPVFTSSSVDCKEGLQRTAAREEGCTPFWPKGPEKWVHWHKKVLILPKFMAKRSRICPKCMSPFWKRSGFLDLGPLPFRKAGHGPAVRGDFICWITLHFSD